MRWNSWKTKSKNKQKAQPSGRPAVVPCCRTVSPELHAGPGLRRGAAPGCRPQGGHFLGAGRASAGGLWAGGRPEFVGVMVVVFSRKSLKVGVPQYVTQVMATSSTTFKTPPSDKAIIRPSLSHQRSQKGSQPASLNTCGQQETVCVSVLAAACLSLPPCACLCRSPCRQLLRATCMERYFGKEIHLKIHPFMTLHLTPSYES